MENWLGFIVFLLIVLVPMSNQKGVAVAAILAAGLIGGTILGAVKLVIGIF